MVHSLEIEGNYATCLYLIKNIHNVTVLMFAVKQNLEVNCILHQTRDPNIVIQEVCPSVKIRNICR